jgi:hypothetical protein
MTPAPHSLDRGACGPSISRPEKPRRHQRSRKPGARTPDGVLYCGRPGDRGNPFRADRFGHARSVRLYRQWIERRLTLGDLERLGFSQSEINALAQWRNRLDAQLPALRGRDLQCWCPLTSAHCHVDVLLEVANR